MSRMRILWLSLGLSALGYLLIWYGAWFAEAVLWLGLLVFSVGMLLGPLTRFVGSENGD